MHEKCTTLFVVTQIHSHLDKYAKIEPAFLPKIMIKIHTYLSEILRIYVTRILYHIFI